MDRHLFSDGVNSIAHVYFGYLSNEHPIGILLFLAYETLLPHQVPIYSWTEFGVGMVMNIWVNKNE